MKIKVVLSGCDDSTYIEMEVTAVEFALINRIADLSDEASEYGCQPTMYAYEVTND